MASSLLTSTRSHIHLLPSFALRFVSRKELHVLKHSHTCEPSFSSMNCVGESVHAVLSIIIAVHANTHGNQPLLRLVLKSSLCDKEALPGCISLQKKYTLCHNKQAEQRLLGNTVCLSMQ